VTNGEVLPSSNRAIASAGERFREYEEVPGDRDLLLRYREFSTEDLAQIFESMRALVAGIPGLLSCRVKRLDSIVRKLRRQHAMDLVRMDDIVGFRLIVPTPEHQSQALDAFESAGLAHRVRDYRDDPPMGYRAVHLIFRRQLQLPGAAGPSNYPYELQLRTYFQHLWASTSESFGESVKEGGGSEAVRSYLDGLSDRIRADEQENPGRLQMEEIHQNAGLALYSLRFDHRSKELESVEPFGDDVGRALRYFGYLEDQAREDLRREIVLLGCSSTVDELKVTHLRYFQPQGVPDLPDRLRPAQERPE
jgi:ppGpp synthetase/RelA/SpoT-type nucleotidyltranferase